MSCVPAPQPPTPRRKWLVRVAVGVAVLALVVVGGWLAAQSYSRSAERRDALARAESGPPLEALSALRKCLERDPDDADLLRAITATLVRAGAPVADVEPHVQNWCRVAPSDPAAFRRLADVLRRLDRYPEALAAAERVAELAPGDARTREEVAYLLLMTGRFDDAAKHYRELLAASPANPDFTQALARAEWERGQPAEAARLLDSLISGRQGSSAVLLLRGMVHSHLGEYEAAATVLRRVEPRSTAELETKLYHLAMALERLNRSDQAKKLFAELTLSQTAGRAVTDAEQRPADVTLQVRAGEALLVANRADEARRWLEGTIARLGPSRGALLALARCYDQLGNRTLANDARQRAAQVP